MSEAARVPFTETKAPESAERLHRGALGLVDISASTSAAATTSCARTPTTLSRRPRGSAPCLCKGRGRHADCQGDCDRDTCPKDLS